MTYVLYVDPWAGVAGDMFLAALLDLERGARRVDGSVETQTELGLEAALRAAIARLQLGDVRLEVESVQSGGIAATRVEVRGPEDAPTRGPAEAEALVAQAGLPEVVTRRSIAALRRLAEVEAGVHGVPTSQVHFHELGAVDTLVDIVGAFTLWYQLGEPPVVCGPLPLGGGRVRTAHGTVGVPAPATAELCRGVPVFGGEEAAEVTTPTGALLVTELAERWGRLPAMRLVRTGYGAGHLQLHHKPNVVRVMLGEAIAAGGGVCGGEGEERGRPDLVERTEMVVMLETHLDDATGERLAHLQTRLLREGALDVWLRQIVMKKGRPGVEVAVLAEPDDEERITDLLFTESGSLGLRRRWVERRCLGRDWVEVTVAGRPVRVKRGWWRGQVVSLAAEYEEAAEAAAETGLSLEYVMSSAAAAARAL